MVALNRRPESGADTGAAAVAPTFTVTLVRPSDQLHLRYEFLDLELVDNELVATSGDAEPAIRVVLGSQHTAEEAVAAGASPGSTPVDSRSAGESRIVFPVVPPIAFDIATLLDLGQWEPALPTTGQTPSERETALEVPEALVIAPTAGTRFAAAVAPHTEGDVSELWTARLDSPAELVVVENRHADVLLTRSPTAGERDDLVQLTMTVAPAEARRLWLSLHGAYLDLLGEWDDEETGGLLTNVVRWMHRAVTGRDLSVEVTTRGYLAPFGHKAAMLTITERQFIPDVDDEVVAVLVQQTYLSVSDAMVTFPRVHARNAGRQFPFQQVAVAGQGWTPVDKGQIEWTDAAGVERDMNIDNAWNVVDLDGNDLMVVYTADDGANPPVTFELPATFIEYENAFAVGGSAPPANLAAYYSAPESLARRAIDLGGRAIAWGADPAQPGSEQITVKVTERVHLNLEALNAADDEITKAELLADRQPNVFPVVERAWVIDDAMASTQGEVGSAIEVVPHARWIDYGNDPTENLDGAYLKLVESTNFPLGGLGRAAVALDLEAEVFNQTTGAGPDWDPAVPWNPATTFGDGSKLLGAFLLKRLLPEEINLEDAVPGIDIPGFDVTYRDGAIVSTFSYSPKLQSIDGFLALDDATAKVEIETVISIDGATTPATTAEFEVRDVALSMPPAASAVTLFFNKVRIVIPPDGSVDVDVDLDRWQLEELLAWLQPLLDLLEAVGGGVSVDITDNALDVALGYTPPAISLGVLSVRNFEIYAGFILPLDGSPIAISAGVGRPDRPVDISLVGFDGSFYMLFGIGGAPTVLQLVSISAEANVQLFGIDVVVAKAAIDLGISGFFTSNNGAVSFGGAISLEGVLDVLGVISVSAGVVGSLTYFADPKNLVAAGRITYSVDTILTKPKEGSTSLGEITYSLGAAGGDANTARALAFAASPTGGASFADRFTPADWLEYTGAFA